MKLDVWQKSIQLFKDVFSQINVITDLNYKLKTQIIDATQSISSNIAEGYCRKSINEYLRFIDIALGSSGEMMARLIGLKSIEKINDSSFEEIDLLNYEVENKLLALKKSLQLKQVSNQWDTMIRETTVDYEI
jgi:four helix bundle protein